MYKDKKDWLMDDSLSLTVSFGYRNFLYRARCYQIDARHSKNMREIYERYGPSASLDTIFGYNAFLYSAREYARGIKYKKGGHYAT